MVIKSAGKDYLAAGKTQLGELEGNELLECYGFSVLPRLGKTGRPSRFSKP